MDVLGCGHAALPGKRRLCRHLLTVKAAEGSCGYARILRGRGVEHDFCCEACAKQFKEGEEIELFEACIDCVQHFEEEDYETLEWIGTPTIKEELVRFSLELRTEQLPVLAASAEAVLPLTSGKVLLYLNKELWLVFNGSVLPLMSVALSDEKGTRRGNNAQLRTRLLASSDEQFVALVHDYGRHGCIVDLNARRVVHKIDRGSYHVEQTLFPIAFFQRGKKQYLIYGSDWNLLNIYDLALHTVSSAPNDADISRYFHGHLLVSPDQQWLIDDAWVWQPAGIPLVLNLYNLSGSLFWGAGGEKLNRRLSQRLYLWNTPMTWVGNGKIAIYGIGPDEEILLKGTRIFDAETGEELNAFAGPSGPYFSDGIHLFSIESDGLHLWDVRSGSRIGRILNFYPSFQVGDELVEIQGEKLRAWDYSSAFGS